MTGRPRIAVTVVMVAGTWGVMFGLVLPRLLAGEHGLLLQGCTFAAVVLLAVVAVPMMWRLMGDPRRDQR